MLLFQTTLWLFYNLSQHCNLYNIVSRERLGIYSDPVTLLFQTTFWPFHNPSQHSNL